MSQLSSPDPKRDAPVELASIGKYRLPATFEWTSSERDEDGIATSWSVVVQNGQPYVARLAIDVEDERGHSLSVVEPPEGALLTPQQLLEVGKTGVRVDRKVLRHLRSALEQLLLRHTAPPDAPAMPEAPSGDRSEALRGTVLESWGPAFDTLDQLAFMSAKTTHLGARIIHQHERVAWQLGAAQAAQNTMRRRLNDPDRLAHVAKAHAEGGIAKVKSELHVEDRQAYRLVAAARKAGLR